MSKGRNDYYKHGDQNALCDECGFKYKLSQLRERWDGAMVCDIDWEPRHPRDLPPPIRGEDPPKPGSPEPTAEYLSITYATTPVVPTGTFDGDAL
jgi:hypothetical protein